MAGGGSIDLFDVAERHRARVPAAGSRPSDLHGVGDITNCAGGYPYGAHACEVDVDTETGAIRVNRWIAVDDVGRAVNPLVLHGQTHGSVAQGLGQALSEAVVYEAGDAQLLTGSFMDYALPRADSTPPIEAVLMEVPATSHPHGIRPGGEGGTTPALAVVVNAVVDALSEFGVEHVEMPLTPERVLAAIRAANRDLCCCKPTCGELNESALPLVVRQHIFALWNFLKFWSEKAPGPRTDRKGHKTAEIPLVRDCHETGL